MRNRILILLTALLTVSAVSFAARPRTKHIVYIGLDGWGAYTMPRADMPTVKSLMERGCWTLQKRSVLPSSSAVNWASMFMGAGPELHGYTTWGSRKPELPSRVLNRNGIFPTIFSLLREQRPEAEIGVLSDWIGIKYLIDTLAVNHYAQGPDYNKHPEALCEMAEKYITEHRPTLTAVIFDNPDHVGHTTGHDTDELYACLHRLDGYIARIIAAVERAGIADETTFIITADHGGLNKNHGGKTMREMETPMILAGRGIRRGGRIEASVMQYDVASTMAQLLGLKQPQVWIGRPIAEVF